MLRALVVDDEPPARRRLARLLAELRAPAVTVVAEAGDGEEALAQIAATAPALVFLDIRMPGLSGLALAQRHQEHGLPPLIFTTAHDEHAVAAFAVHAVDYLLKPISLPRLAQAVARAAARLATPSVALLTTLAQHPPAHAGTRIAVVERGAIRFFDARAIARFHATDKYTAFQSEGTEHLSEEPLSDLEQRLAAHGFLRVHRGELINLACVRALVQQDGLCEVELSDGQRARVSRRLLAPLRAALGLR